MPVTAGLLEGKEPFLTGQVNKSAGAHRSKGGRRGEKAETGEFQRLLKRVNEAEKEEKAEEEKAPDRTGEAGTQLLLFFAQFASVRRDGEISCGGEETPVAFPGEAVSFAGRPGRTADNLVSGEAAEATAAEATGGSAENAVFELDPAKTLTAETSQASAVSGEPLAPAGGIFPGAEFPGDRETKEARPDQPGETPVGAAIDHSSVPAGVDEAGANGHGPVAEVVTNALEQSSNFPDTPYGRPEELPAGPGINGEKTRPTLFARKERMAERASLKQQGVSLAQEAVEESATGDGLAPGLKTAKNHLRQAADRIESLFSPVENGNSSAEPTEELTVTNPQTANVPTEEELKAQIISQAKVMVKNGLTRVKIQLEPAELGKLELSLVVERDLVAARFVAENRGVQSLIEANLPQLRSSLEEAGLRVDLLQVGVQSGSNSPLPQETGAGREQFKPYAGWNPSGELYINNEENVFAEEAWYGMVNLRV